MLKASASDAQKKELAYGGYLFAKGGESREEFKRYPGIEFFGDICIE